MQIFLLIAALIAVLAVIFALQNAVPITVSFLFWQVESSLALILIVAFIAGLITSFLFNILSDIKRTRATASLEKQVEETKKEVITVQEKGDE
ncbi:MAG: LapA family protein [Atribacterota bacterium]|nr:LapA family protein [Atribacterota bacterium]MDD4895911.1 LapA family protein [Atribacterota bacterium]MDD5636535.1 LapA family protein [Atribacterota bacterium]